jgi:hypothetical protein
MKIRNTGIFTITFGLFLAAELLPTGPISGALVLGLFKGILPKKEFRILMGINLLIILGNGVYTQVRVPIVYTTILQSVNGFQNTLDNYFGGHTNFNITSTGNNTSTNTSSNISTGTNSKATTGTVFDWLRFFDDWKFPVNIVLTFLGAGITVAGIVVATIVIIVVIPFAIVFGLFYYGSMLVVYTIYKLTIFTYLPGPMDLVNAYTEHGLYYGELVQMMATSLILFDLVGTLCTIYFVYFVLGRIGFYKMIPVGLRNS